MVTIVETIYSDAATHILARMAGPGDGRRSWSARTSPRRRSTCASAASHARRAGPDLREPAGARRRRRATACTPARSCSPRLERMYQAGQRCRRVPRVRHPRHGRHPPGRASTTCSATGWPTPSSTSTPTPARWRTSTSPPSGRRPDDHAGGPHPAAPPGQPAGGRSRRWSCCTTPPSPTATSRSGTTTKPRTTAPRPRWTCSSRSTRPTSWGSSSSLAGYFVPGALDRKGVGRFVRDRLVRLGIPLLLFVIVVRRGRRHPGVERLGAAVRGVLRAQLGPGAHVVPRDPAGRSRWSTHWCVAAVPRPRRGRRGTADCRGGGSSAASWRWPS